MPETIEISIFRFDELSDAAKAAARDELRKDPLDDGWYEYVFDDFETICRLIGIELKSSTIPLMGGGARQKSCIYFQGFYSQGDGACFEGRYRYRRGTVHLLRAHAPEDAELHRIAGALADVQRRNFYQLCATAVRRGRHSHEYCMAIEVERAGPMGQNTKDAEEIVKDALRDLARWLYRQLERESDYLNSDDVIDEGILANDFRFREDGTTHY